MSGSHGWHKASELPALGRYGKEHPDLNRTINGIRLIGANPDAPPRAPKGRGFFQVLLILKGSVVLVVPSGYYYLGYS